MSLQIGKIALDRFRGYSHLSLDGLGRLSIFLGPNAVGKTNIVEALQLLTSAESFRKPSWSELVSWGQESCAISAHLVDEKRDVEHAMSVDGGQREYRVNGKKKAAAAVRGTCPSVLFIPDDLQMVKASSALRRECLDSLAAQLSKTYSPIRQEYAKTLRQRNLLLREEMDTGPLFESWNDSLVVHGSRLYSNRIRLFRRLAAHMKKIYAQVVAGEKFEVVYLPSWNRFDKTGRQIPDISSLREVPEAGELDIAGVQDEMYVALDKLKEDEHRRKTTLVGPHKDEVAFFIDGRNARTFASQGQQRTIVLVEKLAEVELVKEMMGLDPVLLLDDVMSELDAAHRDALAWFIDQSAQTFITTTNIGYFKEELLQSARVIELPIPGTRYGR